MQNFKVGDIVARKSYNYDVLFRITSINGEIADLVGTTVRIIADVHVVCWQQTIISRYTLMAVRLARFLKIWKIRI